MFCELTKEARSFLEASIDRLGLSGRAFERVLKVARTIADLAGKDLVDVENVAEAVQYRNLDRQYF
jgi:magnesium chelatase family protein